jgi:hypothetical protein
MGVEGICIGEDVHKRNLGTALVDICEMGERPRLLCFDNLDFGPVEVPETLKYSRLKAVVA